MGKKNKNNSKAQRRHLAIFLPSLEMGGAERVGVTLANSFASKGIQVDLVLFSLKGPLIDDVKGGVTLVNLKAKRAITALIPFSIYLLKNRPKSILSILTHTNVVALLANKIVCRKRRLVISEHSTLSINKKSEHSLSSWFLYKLINLLYPSADLILTVSKSAAEDLKSYLKGKTNNITTIYNPFDIKEIRKKASIPTHHEWLEDNKTPIILAVGRLTQAKGFGVLIIAFASLLKEVDARLLILGDGELRSELNNLAKRLNLNSNNFRIEGFVSNPYPFYSKCKIFVLSSLWEGFSNVLVEALACGAKIISTDCKSGPKEILDHGAYGTLIPPNNTEILTKEIKKQLKFQPQKQTDIDQYLQKFDHQIITNQYLSILKV